MLLFLLLSRCVAEVVIRNGQLLVDGAPFKIRGLCYSPVPIGESVNFVPYGDYFTPNYAYIWYRDFPRIKQLGFNTLRIYGWNTALNHSVFLDAVDRAGLKLMITFFLGTTDQNSVRTAEERQLIITQFAQEARRYGDHPAILMWSFGNELNGAWNGFIDQFSQVGSCGYDINCMYSYDSKCLQKMNCTYSLLFGWINAACQAAKQYSARPCTSGFADVDYMVGGDGRVNKISLFDRIVPSMDLWAMQVYRGGTFGGSREDFFSQYREQGVRKPVIITEYGVDAYNDPCGWNENQGKVCNMLPGDRNQRGGDSPTPNFTGCPEKGVCEVPGAVMQAQWDLQLASAINDQLPTVCAGGFLMGWTDEYWKGYEVQDKCEKPCEVGNIPQCRNEIQYNRPGNCKERAHFTCNNFNADFHDLCGYYLPGASFDNYVNEEWFGITKPSPCGQSGNFGAFRLDYFNPRNATSKIALLYNGKDVPLVTCAELSSCHRCSIRHTAQGIAEGACNEECNLRANAPSMEWSLVGGSMMLLLGLTCTTALFAFLPLLGFCGRYSRRQTVAKLFPGESQEFPPTAKSDRSPQPVLSEPYRELGSNVVVLGLALDDMCANFVYHSKLVNPAIPHKIASIDEPFAIALVGHQGESENDNYGAMLLEHIKVQTANIALALSHELRNCSGASQAIGVLHYRMFEAYMCWLEKHRFKPKKPGNLVGEIVVLRVIQSLCDHILHCPERVSQIIHSVFGETIDRGDGVFVIDLDFIQEGLSAIHRSEALNFDDINQAGATNERIKKGWFESSGLGVCLDVLRINYPIVFVKGWIFCIVIWLQLVILHNEPPMFENLEYWEIVAHIDSALYLFVETILFAYTVLLQERFQPLSARSWHRAFGVGLALLSSSLMWIHFTLGGDDRQVRYVLLGVYLGLLRFLMFLVYLPVVERWFGRDSQFVRYGRPLWARKFRRRALEQLANRGAGLAENLLQSVLGNLGVEEQQMQQKTFWSFVTSPFGCTKAGAKQGLFWFVVLILTIGLEFTIVSPIALGFTFHPMCDQSCAGAFDMLQIDVFNPRCVACTLSLFTIYSVITLSCLVDTHFIFQFVLAIVGYCMGNARGLRGVLDTDSLFSSATWSKVPHALLSLFGTTEHADEIWGALVTDLLARDLISQDQCTALCSINLFNETLENDGTMKQLLREPRERLLFFLKTLPVLANQTLHPARSAREYIKHGVFHYDEDEFCYSIPTMSQVITTYSEEIIKSADYLRQVVGSQSNLEYLIEAHSQEWTYFERRLVHTSRPGFSGPLLRCFLAGQISNEVEMEVRLWASYRTQTVARTIRGALTYHTTLSRRLSWTAGDKLRLKDMVELVIAAQTYGQRKDAEAVQRRQDLDYLILKFKVYPISIVFDYTADSADDEDREQVAAYWSRHHGTAFPFAFATVVKALGPSGNLELQAVLPRRNPLRLGRGARQTQGKAANHLNALRKVWGHVTQVLDANMDGSMGEAFKVPFITHMFLERTETSKPAEAKQRNEHQRPMYSFIEEPEQLTDSEIHARKTVVRRIIGFREYIFTANLGGVATIMANSEKTFGTITQRVLDHPLGVRMHYGHPDFFDSFWMLNRGGPSKASPNINLSEDIFSGFNVWLRDEMAAHMDTIEWQKGREEAFTTASMFMSKITAGSVGILRTREFMHMNHGLNIITKFSLLCGGVGYYLAQLLVSTGINLFAITMFLLTLSRVSLDELRLFDAALSIQWVLGFGLCTALPSLSEEILERGLWTGLLEWARTYIQGTLFYLFQNQGVAHAFVVGARTGLAPYANTGRPSFFSPYSKELAYRLYVQSHYYPSFWILALVFFRLVQIGTFSATLAVVSAIVSTWLFAPVLFCPLSYSPSIYLNDLRSSLRFLCTFEGPSSLWNFWLNTNRSRYSEPLSTRVIDICSACALCFLLFLLDSPTTFFLSYAGYLFFMLSYASICSIVCCLPLRARKLCAVMVLLPLPLICLWLGMWNVLDSTPLHSILQFGPNSWKITNVTYGQQLIRLVLLYRAYKLFWDVWLLLFSLVLPHARLQTCIDACYLFRCSFHFHFVLAGVTLFLQSIIHAVILIFSFSRRLIPHYPRFTIRLKPEPLLGDSING